MLNQAIIVGRIKEINENSMVVGVPRAYKNAEGEYDTDFIKCSFNNDITKNVNQCCEIGDIIGVKGRIASIEDKIEIIAEKVSFLSSRRNEEEA